MNSQSTNPIPISLQWTRVREVPFSIYASCVDFTCARSIIVCIHLFSSFCSKPGLNSSLVIWKVVANRESKSSIGKEVLGVPSNAVAY